MTWESSPDYETDALITTTRIESYSEVWALYREAESYVSHH